MDQLRDILPIVPWNHFNGQTWPELKMGPANLFLSYRVWIFINSTVVIILQGMNIHKLHGSDYLCVGTVISREIPRSCSWMLLGLGLPFMNAQEIWIGVCYFVKA